MCFRTLNEESKPFKKIDEIKEDMSLLSDISNINKFEQSCKVDNSPKYCYKNSFSSKSTTSSFKEL